MHHLDLARRFRLARTDPLSPVDAIAVLPTHAGSRAVLATHVRFWAFTALSTDRCVPHSQDYLPADEVAADREFHLAGRSQLLAARYETFDVARLE
ncbi:BQ5605_C006g04152 [Microbotryum silenes-dioicae]|uniref:BQ5605_C006g04152 protein n=1 Tax=Microbotryum silenes-dioicae TaxID=796604 RepID=A0A2X0P8H5_9BASI|nr:BQ5605_C006g04152 [Microbotryum silenes-dioicae]